MKKISLCRFVVAASLSCVSFGASASIIRTLDGVTYEWLELTATRGMTRNEVELELANSSSVLYGYEYASREMVKSLLLSYASFDGLNGWHGDPGVVNGMAEYFNDFGAMSSNEGDGFNRSFDTVDGYTVSFNYFKRTNGLFGLKEECGGLDRSCFTFITIQYNEAGEATMVQQLDNYGWDTSVAPQFYLDTTSGLNNTGSYLVRSTVVPVPAAVWLFGSGLGLLGWMRRRTK